MRLETVMPLAFKYVRLALAEAESAGAPIAVGRRRTRPDDHWNCARLRRPQRPAIADGMVFWGSGY